MIFYRPAPPPAAIDIPDAEFFLRAPIANDYQSWMELRRDSQKFLTPWEPKWPDNDLGKLGFRRRLKRYAFERERKVGETFFLVNKSDNCPIGGISISNIRYGAARACNIGYWMGEQFGGLGHMSKVVPAICGYIFKELKLHRIEAACLPDNERSTKLLLRAGFRREGLVRKYLEINGTRRDHVLYSLLDDEYNTP